MSDTPRKISRKRFLQGAASLGAASCLSVRVTFAAREYSRGAKRGIHSMNYAPKSLYVWDAWTMQKDDEVHLYHLQAKRPGVDVSDDIVNKLGHAVSTDLVNWRELPPVFGPNAADPRDDGQPWTGCALWHENKGYLFYTMRGSLGELRLQHIGLATSLDGANWHRYENNPVVTPDMRWYATPQNPTPGTLDCRDLVVVPDQKNGGWWGFYATRVPGKELPQTSAIACAHSLDLIRWEQRPPAFVPGNYSCVEVPDVFQLNGLWYMTCLAGNVYGNRGYWHDPNLVNGTMYAVSERPEGPYEELTSDNALLGARTTGALSCRSLMFQGERHLLYTDRERTGHTDAGDVTFGTLSTPKLLRADGQRLFAAYSPRIESEALEELIGKNSSPVVDTKTQWGQIWQIPTAQWTYGDRISGSSESGWGVALFQNSAESFIFEANITLERGVAAGFLLRAVNHMSGAVVALDAEEQCVLYADAPHFDWTEKRRTPLELGKTSHLRVVQRLEHIEVYLDDNLRLAFSRYKGIGGQVGLFVDRGTAHFSDIRLRTLKVSRAI